jgi:c-di-GMP-binding flagellar brake protein YcgR
MSDNNASDRRRHPRHFISGLAEVGAYKGKLVDLSISGFQAVVNGESEKDRKYSCQLILAEGGSHSTLKMTGIVRHLLRQRQNGEVRIGVEFAAIEEQVHWQLMDCLATLARTS